MRVHAPLDEIFRGRGTLRVLRRFCGMPAGKFSAPELAKLEGLALSHVQGALATLEGEGLIDRAVVGRTHLWSLASGNQLVEPLTALFRAERELPKELERQLTSALSKLPLRSAILFGSVSAGEEAGGSDVDLYLETQRASDQDEVFLALVPLALIVRERFGLNLAPIVVTARQRGEGVSAEFTERIQATGKSLISTS